MTKQFRIIAGIPANRKEVTEIFGIPDEQIPRPTTLYTLMPCDNPFCTRDIWCGPRTLAQAQEWAGDDDYVIWKLCYICVAQVQQAAGHEFPVKHFGGGAGVEGVVR